MSHRFTKSSAESLEQWVREMVREVQEELEDPQVGRALEASGEWIDLTVEESAQVRIAESLERIAAVLERK